jgi:hypothetical protein
MPDTDELGQAALEFVVEATGGQPAVERRLDQILQLRRPQDLSGNRDRRALGLERLRHVGKLRVVVHQIQNPGAQVNEAVVALGHGRTLSECLLLA